MKTASTAAAAQSLLTEPPDCAAICSTVCAKLYEGLEILFTGIQDMAGKNLQSNSRPCRLM